MSKKTKKILAYVALGFMAVFTVTFIVWLTAPHLLQDRFGFFPLVSGLLGVGFFLVVKLIKTPEEKIEADNKAAYLPESQEADLSQSDLEIADQSAQPDDDQTESSANKANSGSPSIGKNSKKNRDV